MFSHVMHFLVLVRSVPRHRISASSCIFFYIQPVNADWGGRAIGSDHVVIISLDLRCSDFDYTINSLSLT